MCPGLCAPPPQGTNGAWPSCWDTLTRIRRVRDSASSRAFSMPLNIFTTPARGSKARAYKKLHEYTDEREKAEEAAARITKHLKTRHAMYSHFGPMVFCKKSGDTSDFGEIAFTGRGTKAKWITVSDKTSPGALGAALPGVWASVVAIYKFPIFI